MDNPTTQGVPIDYKPMTAEDIERLRKLMPDDIKTPIRQKGVFMNPDDMSAFTWREIGTPKAVAGTMAVSQASFCYGLIPVFKSDAVEKGTMLLMGFPKPKHSWWRRCLTWLRDWFLCSFDDNGWRW